MRYDQQPHPSQRFTEDKAFLRAESRKRRFDVPGAVADEYDNTEQMLQLDETLREMNEQVSQMHVDLATFAEEKHAYFKEMEITFDSDGNRVPQYDRFGNLIDTELLGEPTEAAPGKMVKIEIPLLQITQGVVWRKGRGVLSVNRAWKRRFFQIDLEKIRPIYYFDTEQRAMIPMQQGESAEYFRQRKTTYWNKQRQMAKGTYFLGDEHELARVSVPENRVEHKNPNINDDYIFELYIPGEGVQTLCTETEQEFHQWIATIQYITDVMAKNRAIMRYRDRNGGRDPTPAAGAVGEYLTQEQVDEKRDFALNAVHAFGKGLFEANAGYPAEFFVQIVDPALTAPITAEQITAVMESKDLHFDLTVQPFGHELGMFQVTYLPTRPGKYELSVLLDRFDIQNSPFHPTVRPAPVSAPHCVAEGTALYCGIAGGAVNRILIKCRNLFGEDLRNVRGVEFQVTASPLVRFCDCEGNVFPPNQQVLQENGDGTYAVYYLVDDAETMERLRRGESVECSISIELDDGLVPTRFEGELRQTRPIRGSPFGLVLAESATGQALATAAMHASRILTGNQMDELMSFAEEDQSFFRIAAVPQRQQIAPSFIVEAEQQADEEEQQRLAKEAVERIRAAQQQQPQFDHDEQKQDLPHPSSSRRQSQDDDFYRSRRNQSDDYYRQNHNQADDYFRSRRSSDVPRYEEDRRSRENSMREELRTDSYLPRDSNTSRRDSSSAYRREQDPFRLAGGTARAPPAATSFQEEELLRERKLQQQREAELALEREQLLKMRRDLQTGQNEIQEHLSRLNLSSSLSSDNTSGLPPPAPPAQYRKSAAPPPAAPRSSSYAATTTALTTQDNNPTNSNPFDAEITAMFNAKARELKRIFRHYAAYQDTPTTRPTYCTLPGFLSCWIDYEICPTFISKKEVQAIYKKRIDDQGLHGMDFPIFVEALGLVAFAALEKPPLSQMYPTPAKQIGVLLGMWRFGDSTALDNIVKRQKYARN